MSSSLLSFVLLCIVFVHSATAQDLESSKKYDKALDSKDKGYGMDAPTYDGYKTKDYLDSKDNGYKNKDSKDGEYEMRSILNGYKTKDYKKNDGDDKNGKDLYEKEYFNDPYKREYFNNDPYKREYRTDPYAREYRTDPYARTYRTDPYAREYRGPCCAGQELSGGLCYPICHSGFQGAGPACWDGPVFFSNSYGRGAGKFPYSSC